MWLQAKNLMQKQKKKKKDFYNPIDLNHIFNDDDILDEWIQERNDPILSSNNLDWLDKGLLLNEEDRETIHEDDGAISHRVGKHTSNTTQERDIDSRHEGKASRIVFSSSNSDDSDNRDNKGGGGTCEGGGGGDGTSEGIGGSGGTGGSYVSQADPDMSWAWGDENYYTKQDTNHGYRPRIWDLERLTTFPNDDDYSSGHDYHRFDYHYIDEHLHTLVYDQGRISVE